MKHLTEKALLAKLNVTQWSGVKKEAKVNSVVQREFNTGDNAGFYSKRLVEKDLLTKIRSQGEKARKVLYKFTLPWLDDGARILPAKNFLKCRAEVEKIEQDREELIKEFVKNYESMKTEAELRLGDLYDERDYPDWVEDKFTFDLSFLPIADVTDFRVQVSENEMSDIKASAEAAISGVMDKTVKDVFLRAKRLLSALADKLKEKDAIFRNTLIGNVAEFCDLLPALNITDNAAITQLYVDLKEKIASIDADTLRNVETARKDVAQAADDLLKGMKGYC